jgi:hypothetical protein
METLSPELELLLNTDTCLSVEPDEQDPRDYDIN